MTKYILLLLPLFCSVNCFATVEAFVVNIRVKQICSASDFEGYLGSVSYELYGDESKHFSLSAGTCIDADSLSTYNFSPYVGKGILTKISLFAPGKVFGYNEAGKGIYVGFDEVVSDENCSKSGRTCIDLNTLNTGAKAFNIKVSGVIIKVVLSTNGDVFEANTPMDNRRDL